jgi:hypothetical protein
VERSLSSKGIVKERVKAEKRKRRRRRRRGNNSGRERGCD